MNTIALHRQRVARSASTARACFASIPAFAIVAILSLALGVGANTAIFQLLDAVRLRTLPVKDPAAARRSPHRGYGRTDAPGSSPGRRPKLTNPLWEQIRDRQQAFSGRVRVERTRLQSDDRRRGALRAGLVGQRRFLQHARRHAAARPRR